MVGNSLPKFKAITFKILPAMASSCDFFLEYIISEYADTREVISDNGSSSQQNSLTQGGDKSSISSLHDCRRYQMSTQSHQLKIFISGENTPRSYVVSNPDGARYSRKRLTLWL